MIAIHARRIRANGLDFAIDECGEGDDVALFLHGFPEARASWRAQLPHMAAQGWRAVAPDLRGYGETTRPAGQQAYLIDHLCADVAALFDALGARRRLLIGHDWGGVIAWQVAIGGAVPLDGLVILNAPHPAVFREVLNRGWRQRLRSWYVLAFQLPWLPELMLTRGHGAGLARAMLSHSPDLPADLLELYRRNVRQPGAATAMVDYYRANALALAARPTAPQAVAVPTLMIWGEQDQALDIALTQGNEAYVADLTLRRLPGVSHFVQHEASDQVTALIAAWMDERGLLSASL